MSAASSLLFLICVLFTTSVVNAFGVLPFSSRSNRRAVLVWASPLAKDALACFPYEFRSNENEKRRSIMDVTERQALTTFEELARLYGEERALNMVRIQPLVLAIRSCQNFEPALDTWSQTFGAEAAQAMVARNPGLLFIQPELAQRDAFGAMAWSYILWATRPVLSKLVLIGFLFYQYASVATSEDGLPSWLVHASDGL